MPLSGNWLQSTESKLLTGNANETFTPPAYITHVRVQVVKLTIKRVKRTLSPILRNLSEGLAEVFCLTDPSREDQPIIFAAKVPTLFSPFRYIQPR